jgi:hypothetical protein
MKAVLWVVEVRDHAGHEWRPSSGSSAKTRVQARARQDDLRRMWRFTRIVRYVREET